MPTETRYMRSDQHTINDLQAYKLITTQGDSSTNKNLSYSNDVTVQWGIKIAKRESDGTQTYISDGPVAIVERSSDGSGLQSATYDISNTVLTSTDAIVIEVYMKGGTSSWSKIATFITEQLDAQMLNSTTWTIYYYTKKEYTALIGKTYGYFYFGSSTYNSRIENFEYTPYSWKTGWSYRKYHVINSASGAGTNYQKRIKVHYGSGTDSGEDVYLNSHSRTDFGDIRFTKDDGTTELDYWRQEKVDSDYAIFWVEISDNLDSSDVIIYIYYGKSDATYPSLASEKAHGEATFLFFDDFKSTTLDSNKWTNQSQASGIVNPTENYLELKSSAGSDTRVRIRSINSFTGGLKLRMEWNLYQKGGNDQWSEHIALDESTDWTANYRYAHVYTEYGTDQVKVQEKYDGTVYTDADNVTLTANVWRERILKYDSDKVFGYLDDEGTEYEQSLTLHGDRTSQGHYIYIQINNWASGSGTLIERYRYLFLANFVDPEPQHGSWGSEETAPPQVIIKLLSFKYPNAVSKIADSSEGKNVILPFQRKTFYAKGRFWVFAADGTNMVYYSSTNGGDWTSATSVRSCDWGSKFSVWTDGDYVYYAYANSSSIYYRRGTLQTNGNITWDSEETVSTSYNSAEHPVIIKDSNGYIWISYTDVTDSSKYPFVIKSGNSDGSWGTTPSGFPYQLSTTANSRWFTTIAPLTGGKVTVFYDYDESNIYCRSWNGSSWLSETQTSSQTHNAETFSVVADGDKVCLAFQKITTSNIIYVEYSYSSNSFGSEETVISKVETRNSPPIISKSNLTGYKYIFYLNYPSYHHIYRTSTRDNFGTTKDWIDESSETIQYPDRIQVFSSSDNKYIGVVYTTSSSSPYHLKYAIYVIPLVLRILATLNKTKSFCKQIFSSLFNLNSFCYTKLRSLFKIRSLTTRLLLSKYLIRNFCSIFITLNYKLLKLIFNSIQLRWNIKKKVIQVLTNVYKVFLRLENTFIILYKILTITRKTLSTLYSLKKFLSKFFSIVFIVKTFRTIVFLPNYFLKNFRYRIITLGYLVKKLTYRIFSIPYLLREFILRKVVIISLIKELRRTILTTTFKLRKYIHNICEIIYSYLGTVFKIIVFKNNLLSFLSTHIVFSNSIFQRIHRTITLLTNNLIFKFRDIKIVNHIQVFTSSILYFFYNLRVLSSKILSINWKIRVFIDKIISLLFSLSGLIRKELLVIYKLLILRRKEFILKNNILNRLYNSLTLITSLRKYISKILISIFNLRIFIPKIIGFKYKTKISVHRIFSFKFGIISFVERIISFAYSFLGFYIEEVTCTPFKVHRAEVESWTLRCDWHDEDDLTIDKYKCQFWIRDESNNIYGPYTGSITKEGSKEYYATYDLDPDETFLLGKYDIKVEVTKYG